MTESDLSGRRVAGVTIPLFSLRSTDDWGIGEIPALKNFAQWIATAGIQLVQILPLGEIAAGETSPYSALTAFGIDPIYVSIAGLEDLPPSQWPAVLGEDFSTLATVRASDRVAYHTIRGLKVRALRGAYNLFARHHRGQGTARDHDFAGFCAAERDWLDDYALFRALRDAHDGRAWWEWPQGLRDRSPEAMRAAVETHRDNVYFHAYTQWVAHTQWAAARRALRAMHFEVMGDLPFMVGRDSADVWAHQGDFRDDAIVGAPPDYFNTDGQDWGLPPYNWAAMQANGFRWLTRRTAYNAGLYDRFRVDHLVGFFRTYIRPAARLRDENGRLVAGSFDPADEAIQAVHGEQVLTAMLAGALSGGAGIIAEDLGVIPTYVRPVLQRLGIPGYKVLIWERAYDTTGQPFLDPRTYPRLSVACCGTHDTDPVSVWWETRDAVERAAVQAIPGMSLHGELPSVFTPSVHSALLHILLGAGSDLALLLIQDVLGTRDRINVPATVGPHNWTWRLPGTPDDLSRDASVTAALARVRTAVVAGGRAP